MGTGPGRYRFGSLILRGTSAARLSGLRLG
jgi:hypothetical protein